MGFVLLPTSRWKLKQTLLKVYASKISHLEGNIRFMQTILGELIDASDYEAAASMQLIVAKDEQVLAELHGKVAIVKDEESFNEVADSLEGEVDKDEFLE